MTVTHHLQQPTRRLPGGGGHGSRPGQPCDRPSLLLGLAPDGGCLAAAVARCAGGLLHHLFTLTCPFRGIGGMSLWPYPRVAPPGCYPAPHPVESGLSSRQATHNAASPRSPDRLKPAGILPQLPIWSITRPGTPTTPAPAGSRTGRAARPTLPGLIPGSRTTWCRVRGFCHAHSASPNGNW